jgi:protein-S-isoprenylcysteine O-methyltransferase Ste14
MFLGFYQMKEGTSSVAAVLQMLLWWVVWFYPFIFRAPHRQKRPNVTVAGPTRVGLLFEIVAIAIAFAFRVPRSGAGYLAASAACGLFASLLSWTAVRHLGKQFRLHAGLYTDHELVRTGPYSIVRHPIYASLLAMLLCTIFVWTPWHWALISIAIFIAGTEIRVRTEDRLLASRFGEDFQAYKQHVSAYIPFVR